MPFDHASSFCSGQQHWTIPSPQLSPCRHAPDSAPYTATLPTDAVRPEDKNSISPTKHGPSNDGLHSNTRHSARERSLAPPPEQILAAIGIYGVMSFLVTQGTADIAIRVALGAHRASILSLVFRQGMGLACLGMVAGLIGALGLTRLMNSLLFGVKPTDPLAFFSVLALLLFVALFACLVPAGRAMRIDPMTALRTE